MASILNERIHIFNPQFLVESVKGKLIEDCRYWNQEPHILHDFFSWGIKKAFSDITGFAVDDFRDNPVCQNLYNNYKPDFEMFMFSAYREMGNYLFKDAFRFNLVLTHERLYVISY